MKKTRQIEIGNIAWLFYLSYIVLILLVECADLLCYIAGLPQVTLVSRIIVAACFSILLFFLKDKICILTPYQSKLSWIAFLVLLVLGILKGTAPDTSADVANYHLLAQSPGFIDAFGYHIAPGNFQLFGFRLPDRMFYIFRMLLGFRMGTLLNSLVLFLMYLQVRDILVIAFGDKLSKLRSNAAGKADKILNRILFNESLIALLIILTHDACMQFGTYMVDMLAIPVMLEMLRILLKKKESEKVECAYYAFLAGLVFCMKMTNIVYMAPLLICFLVKNRKQLTVALFTGCFALAIIPVSIYLTYNFIETGNPVFPYYNKIFKSEFFPVENFKDNRWGFANFKDYLIWPFYMVFKPEYRLSEIPDPWAIGGLGIFVSAVYFIISSIRKKKFVSPNSPIYIVFIIAYFLWAYTTGHIRYFLFGYVLGGIMLVDMLSTALLEWKQWSVKALSILLACLFALGPFVYVSEAFAGHEWSWRIVSEAEINLNRELVFNDHDFATEEQRKKIDVFLLNDKSNGSIAHQIKNNVPIIFNNYVHYRLTDALATEAAARIEQYFNEELGVYDISFAPEIKFESYVENLNKFSIKLITCEWLESIYRGKANYILMKLDALKEGEQNVCRYANKDVNNQIKFRKTSDDFSMILHAGYTVNYGWYPKDNVYLQVSLSDEAGNEVSSMYPVVEGEFYTLAIEEDLTKFTDEIIVNYRLIHSDGSLFDVNGPNAFAVLTYDMVGGEIQY